MDLSQQDFTDKTLLLSRTAPLATSLVTKHVAHSVLMSTVSVALYSAPKFYRLLSLVLASLVKNVHWISKFKKKNM